MKVCKNCGIEIDTLDGVNLCYHCKKNKKQKLFKKQREQVYKDLGLVKVKGNLGGIYWE